MLSMSLGGWLCARVALAFGVTAPLDVAPEGPLRATLGLVTAPMSLSPFTASGVSGIDFSPTASGSPGVERRGTCGLLRITKGGVLSSRKGAHTAPYIMGFLEASVS